jgi:hypothetical protein
MTASALLYSGGADSLVVRNCTFNRGGIGISLVGPAQDNMAHGSSIIGNHFEHQNTNSVVVRNQVDAVVDSNVCNDVYANSSYALLFQDCSGATKVTRNTVYVSSGASCIGVTNFFGSASGYAIIANNMIVSDDQGTSNMLTTPLNIITADYAKVVFNSVKMTAPARNGIAAATFGGGVLSNSYFFNNIVACYDTLNFAFNFIPTADSVNYVGNNIYYSRGHVLNKYDGVSCLSFADWGTHYPLDLNSQNVNPGYLSITPTDLRSYSQNVKGHGTPVAEVPADIFGTVRNAATPCVGAFEFLSIPYDFEIIEFLEPQGAYCDAPTAAPIKVIIKNSGINAYDPTTAITPVQISFSRGGTPGVLTPGLSGTVPVNVTIPALDTVTFNLGVTLPYPTNGLKDSTYRLYVWLTSNIDPNPANDTNYTEVSSLYHAPAPTSISMNCNYGDSATVAVTSGLQNWYSNIFTNSTNYKSQVYWYASPDDDTPIWRGSTFTTGQLFTDTVFYIRQKRDLPLIKITEVQFSPTATGATYPMPLWMNANTSFAVELTNVGDYPANLLNDTIMTVSSTSSLDKKVYKFPNITVEPGKTIVVQFVNGNLVNTNTIQTGTKITPPQSANIGVLYVRKGKIEDAVAFNGITTQNKWTEKNVPNYVWGGAGISLPDSIPTAGVTRTRWTTGNSNDMTSVNHWRSATNSTKMTLGTTNTNLIRYTDNGCLGDTASVHIHMINVPTVDLALDDLVIDDGCGMDTTPISVTIHNYGVQPTGQVVVHYKVEARPIISNQATMLQTCDDTIAAGLTANGVLNHTFSVVPDFSVAAFSVDFDVTVWVDALSADNAHSNDTVRTSVTSSKMPAVPNVPMFDTVSYGDSITLLSPNTAWYDLNMNPLDTCHVFTSPILYQSTMFYASAFSAAFDPKHIGNLTSLSAANGYPSPYNFNKKYVKEQYLYTAADLLNEGCKPGPLQSIAFYLDTINYAAGTVTLLDYQISIGTTSSATFTSNNAWQPVTLYYAKDSLVLSNSSKGWITHYFDSAFVWNGIDNIVVQVTHSVGTTATQGLRTRYTNGGSNKVLYKNDNNSSVVNFTNNGTRSANRPDIQFGFYGYGCESAPVPVYVTVDDFPACDASLSWGDNSDLQPFSSCDTSDINIHVKNMGVQALTNYTIYCQIDNQQYTFNGTDSINGDVDTVLTVAKHLFTPGRHRLRVFINADGDSISSNDTITGYTKVSFCAGTYSIGPSGMYANFKTAIDTLNNAGVEGPVVFLVENGVYNEQVELGVVDGATAFNTVTFRGDVNAPENVTLRFNPTSAANYVLRLDGASFVSFEGITFFSRGSGNYGHVISLANTNQIRFRFDAIRAKGNVNNNNTSCFIIGEGVRSLYVERSTIDSGYCAFRSMVGEPGASSDIHIIQDSIRYFMNTGIHLRKVEGVIAQQNYITSAGNRTLTGIFVAEHEGAVTIERNNVVLADNYNAIKQGIKVVNANGATYSRGHVNNNMCAISGALPNGSCAGIIIDSSSNINVFYNTTNIHQNNVNQAGNSSNLTRSMSITTTSNEISVMNNLISNMTNGYALYVQHAANISNANYNNYYSASEYSHLNYWNAVESFDLNTIRTTNGMDQNSMSEEPFFESPSDLHVTLGTFNEKAQYNTETPLDIDGTIRPQIPNPCIGAHEFERVIHNIAVVKIIKPNMKYEVVNVPDNIESDTLWVHVRLMNDGMATESNLTWWAEIKDVTPQLRSANRTIDELLPQATIDDSAYIVMPLGVYDTQTVVVNFPLPNDIVPANNVMEQTIFLDPAYNLRAKEVLIHDVSGCRLQNTHVGVTLTNVGRKTFTAGTAVPVGFQAVLQTSGVTVATLPVVVTESITLPTDVEPNADITLDLQQTVNLYPTGIDKDIVIRGRAWSSYQYDWKPTNDTSNYKNHNSYYTPNSPIGTDIHIPYATWDTLFATQTDNPPTGSAIHRPIRWHRDSTETAYYSPSTYAPSTFWETPQYFRDTVYYLSCISAHGANPENTCVSYYSAVHVYINPRVPVDMAALSVVEPVNNRVYMTDDSVKVKIINYGSQAQSNIPIVYELYNKNGQLLQHVSEVCTATVQPDSTYTFCFDSLVHIDDWTSSSNPYYFRVWTDMTNEGVRLNDTLRYHAEFGALTDDAYQLYNNIVVENNPGLDITRVAYSSLDNVINSSGHKYINFTDAQHSVGVISTPQTLANGLPDYGGTTNAQQIGELRALHLIKGTTDTMIVECANSDRSDDFNTPGWLSVWVDMNRDGYFQYTPKVEHLASGDSIVHYEYPYTDILYHDSIVSGTPLKFLLTIPDEIRTGYTRMRIILHQNAKGPKSQFDASIPFGQIQDYLLYIEDRPVANDVAAARIVSPRHHQIGGATGVNADSAVTVTFQVANKGSNAVNSLSISYSYAHARDGVQTATMQWTGNILPGHSEAIELPARVYSVGVTDLTIVVSAPNDTNPINDTLLYQYYHAPVKTLVFSDDFEKPTTWYIPTGYSPYSQNLWQIGRSYKPHIMASVSDSCVLTTNVNGFNNVYTTGNVSYAYTPLIDIKTIRPDTLTLWIARDMATNHLTRLEFLNYKNAWQTVGTASDTLWYNRGTAWDTVSSGYGYQLCKFPLSNIGGDFQQTLQFRLVYKALEESSACDGAAVDNFVVGRARRNLDVGVIAITHPTEPKFGQTINPRVVVKNYGLDTLYEIELAYLPYGVNLARTGIFRPENGLLPGETATYQFTTPFIVRNDFPDTFQICSYTIMNMDMYDDNDSVCSDFYLSPLDNDMGAVSFISPTPRVVAGDSIVITARIRNFGQAPVHETDVTFIFNESYTVTEHINFNDILGHDLQSFEFLNYSFHQKIRASMGVMHFSAYVNMETDDYRFNDTINMSVDGLSAITDLKASGFVLDTSGQNVNRMQVIVENVGARAANDFKVGFWYYNDTSTLHEAVYHGETPLPALATLIYVFPDSLPQVSALYQNVTAYVYVAEDNDRTNDTTHTRVTQYYDLTPLRVLVEENRYDSCRVRVEVENLGNIPSNIVQPLKIKVNINGTQISQNFLLSMPPGSINIFDLNKKVPKDPNRHYEGSCTIEQYNDKNKDNDQTTRIEVVNYLGIPLAADGDGMQLHQNYPNPFTDGTRIDFYLPTAGKVRFFVIDGMGRMVYQSVNVYGEGEQSIDFHNDALGSGTYYYGIEKDGERLMRKMVLKR